jgi:hypothetical protein
MNSVKQIWPGHRRDVVTGLIAGVLVGAFGIMGVWQVQAANARPPLTLGEIARQMPVSDKPLSRASKVGDVIGLLLNSHSLWKTVQATAITVWLPGTSDEQTVNTTLTVAADGKANLHTLQHDVQGSLMFDTTWVSDGQQILKGDGQRQLFTRTLFPRQFAQVENGGPQAPSAGQLVSHPMALIIPSKLAQYIFPTELAQQTGDWMIEGEDTVANRATLVVSVSYADNQGQPAGQARYWVDVRTGVILKAQQWVPGYESLYQETVVSKIEYDGILPANTFSVDPTGSGRVVSQEEFEAGQP